MPLYKHPCWFDSSRKSSPSKRIPDATHSKTLRNDSPAPIGLSDVPIAFSTSSSRGYVEMTAQSTDTTLTSRFWSHSQKGAADIQAGLDTTTS